MSKRSKKKKRRAAALKTATYGSNWAKDCHKGMHKIATVGKCEIWGGAARDFKADPDEFDLYLSLLGTRGMIEPAIVVSDAARGLLPDLPDFSGGPAGMSIDWPDGSIPDLWAEDWKDLADSLKGFEGKVAVFCFGGHGRTGTALCCLLHFMGAIPEAADPVKWLRARYCEEVVETIAQINYVKLITGRTVNAVSAYSARPISTSSYSGPGTSYYDGGQGAAPFASTTSRGQSNLPLVVHNGFKTPGSGSPAGHDVAGMETNAAGDVTWRAGPGGANYRRNDTEWANDCKACGEPIETHRFLRGSEYCEKCAKPYRHR